MFCVPQNREPGPATSPDRRGGRELWATSARRILYHTNMNTCPCFSDLPLSDCCGSIISGTPAPTALQLMRSRYSAYAMGNIDYLLATQDPETRDVSKRDSMERWSKSTDWTGLTIVATEKGGTEDETGIVEFIARGTTNGKPFALHERSQFRKRDGAWYYVDGTYTT